MTQMKTCQYDIGDYLEGIPDNSGGSLNSDGNVKKVNDKRNESISV